MALQEREQSFNECIRCSNCRWVPSMESSEFAHICPSIIYGKFHSYTGGGKMITAYALLHDVIELDEKVLDSVYACSSCGGCEMACNAALDDLVEPQEGIYALRQHVVSEGKLPAALAELLTNLRKTGRAAGAAAPERGDWCRGLEGSTTNNPDLLLLVGDSAMEETFWPQLQQLVATLKDAGTRFVIGGANEVDSGGLAFEIGDKELALHLAKAFTAMVKASGATTILTPDDGLFASLRAIFPRLGVALPGTEILHVSQWLARRQTVQGPSDASSNSQGRAKVTYHDTCRLGRLSDPFTPWSGEHKSEFGSLRVRASDVPTRFGNGGVYDEPRALLAASGASLIEMPRRRETSFCCGLGGGAKAYSPEFANLAARERLKEACSTGADTLVVSGADCACHLRCVARAENLPIKVETLLGYLQNTQEGR